MKSIIHGTAEGDGNDIRDIIRDKFSICSSSGVQYDGSRALSQQPRPSTKTLQYKCRLIAASTESLILIFLCGFFQVRRDILLMRHRQTSSTHSPVSCREVLQRPGSRLQSVVVVAAGEKRQVEPHHLWLVQQLQPC